MVPAGAVFLAPPRSLSEAVAYLENGQYIVSSRNSQKAELGNAYPVSSEYRLAIGSVTFSKTLL